MTSTAVRSPAPALESRPWWRRVHLAAGWRWPAAEPQHEGLERLLTLLEAARAGVAAGWVQGGWWARPAADGQQILATGLAAGLSVPQPGGAVCLVGALVQAGAGSGGESEAGRAIDVAYDALWESRSQPAAPGPGLLTVSSPEVRRAKTQALARWNDTPGRTNDEVLAVLDRAIARVIQNLAVIPAPVREPARSGH